MPGRTVSKFFTQSLIKLKAVDLQKSTSKMFHSSTQRHGSTEVQNFLITNYECFRR